VSDPSPSSLGHGYTRNDRRSARPILGICLSFLALGVLIGGWIFSPTLPRFVVAIKDCDHCMTPQELAGLVGSIGVQKMGGALPFVVAETDKCIVIKHPFPYARIHYVVVPKKDIKDIGRLSDDDMDYLNDCFATMRAIINREGLRGYRIFTNGPALQSVAYLHFHLISNDKNRDVGRVEKELSLEHERKHGIVRVR
jgi:histidine triad (HIT) family protein